MYLVVSYYDAMKLFNVCGGLFLCSTGLPPAILLLYWVGLPPAVLSPSVPSRGVDTGPTRTQLGPAYVQIMSRLPGAYLRQTELF